MMNERKHEQYDLIIIGGGAAGLTAGLYAARYRLKTILIEKDYLVGGQMLKAEYVENYPGFEKPILGQELASKMEKQASSFGLEIIKDSVVSVDLQKDIKTVQTDSDKYTSKSLIICTGSSPRLLNVPGEKEFYGRGVSYCATCDAPFYKDKIVAVAGGGNTAVDEAIYLTKYARKVYIIHRRDELRADKIVQKRAFSNSKIEMVWNSTVKEINFSEPTNKHIVAFNKIEQNERSLQVDGIFVFIGIIPNTELFNNQLDMSPAGFIRTDENMRTNIPGVFAAGDVREKELRQIVCAVSDGALAAFEANKFLNK